uniref:Uncharacterized protein n=1 Tax=Cajanus cajan TaxID=3821 RepID=A0A151TNY2_CAJCA|nr:hypothetical protein KK1_022335 [Cajanus cajan]
MLPLRAGTITRAACFVPRNTPTRLMFITASNSDFVLSRMLALIGPLMPALFTMMSSLPCSETAAFTAFSTSFSFVTSQWT